MHERITTATGSIQESIKTFMFGVSVAAMALILSPAEPAGTQAEPKVAWSVNLNLRSTDDIPKRLREPEGPRLLALAKGKESLKAGNCEEYLNAVSAGFHPATNHDYELSAEFVHDCFVLRDLQHARAATVSSSYRLTKDSLTQLPPMLVRGAHEATDAAEQAEKRGESWKQFDPDLKVTRIDADSLNAEDKDATYFLTFRAAGDFTDDGVEQIAVFASANGKHGSWYHVEYLILEPTNHGTLVRVTERRAPYRLKATQTRRASLKIVSLRRSGDLPPLPVKSGDFTHTPIFGTGIPLLCVQSFLGFLGFKSHACLTRARSRPAGENSAISGPLGPGI